ncbi:NAD(P)/FAD-dependent oxidoreductase [Desulfotomaculum sp. 1211_IL3151]|uniref:NAD(P)/FAD-dependent oxidoreductase n=1 Tax=Desulfotomaculum sp. 1211_IL3151 TaxID=3084055 RepID=UPI002FDB5B42
MKWDVLVVGGGPAGMMAAARAAMLGARVLLLEKNESLGRKMLITGGGRCNLTNCADINEMIINIPGNGKFVYGALHRFSGEDLRSFLRTLGIKTKVEERGRVFPVSDRAADVVQALTGYLKQIGVKISYAVKVSSLLVADQTCQGVKINDQVVTAKAVVVATGGLSYPATGSTGDGYKLARQVGHAVTPLLPAAVSITCNDPWILNREVQGLSLKDVTITLYNQKGKTMAAEVGDVIVTHWGLSGPGALRVSRPVALACQKDSQALIQGKIDLFPGYPLGDLEQKLTKNLGQAGKRSIKNILAESIPERLTKVILRLVDIPLERPSNRVSHHEISNLTALLKGLPIHITGTRPIQEATITAGGIKVNEINPRTMESKLMKGLFFAGEVLDVDAQTGGFNMQVAFSTGYVAGESAANFI